MRRRRRRLPAAFVFLLSIGGCIGNTGGDAIDFPVAAAGRPDAVAGQPLACHTEAGWDVTITRASLHVGAVYLNQRAPTSGGQATGCFLTGTYVAQETSARDVDLLSATPQPFPVPGHGVTLPAPRVGEIWLDHGDVNAPNDVAPVLTVEGTVSGKGTTETPFSATITIGSKYQSSGASAGGAPICKKRIVTPIPGAPALEPTGGLLVRIDGCALVEFIDFGQVPADAGSGALVFPDDPASPVGVALYSNLVSTSTYSFSWAPDL